MVTSAQVGGMVITTTPVITIMIITIITIIVITKGPIMDHAIMVQAKKVEPIQDLDIRTMEVV
jgi:hypothetical protein